MAKAIREGRESRCDVQQTSHVLEVMCGFATSAETGEWVEIGTDYHRPAPMKKAVVKGVLD